MRLCDDEGNVLAQIYMFEEQRVGEEMTPEGGALSTDEVQEHLGRLCDSGIPPGDEFRVEWIPQSLEDLEAIWRASDPPPPPHRQWAAAMRLIRYQVNLIDRKLRAWTTLPDSSAWRNEGYVLLIEGPLDVSGSEIEVEANHADEGATEPIDPSAP